MPETLFRCSECGKWSHAKRQPLRHLRFVPYANGEPPEDTIEEVVAGTYNHMNDTSSEGGWFVHCGPFEPWLAKPVARNPRLSTSDD